MVEATDHNVLTTSLPSLALLWAYPIFLSPPAGPSQVSWTACSGVPGTGPVENRPVASEVWLLEFLNLLKWMGNGQTPRRNVEGKAELLPAPEKGSFLTLTPAQITVHHTSHQAALPAPDTIKSAPTSASHTQPSFSWLVA